MKRVARQLLLRLHRDDRGAISVLVLLTIWCLVAGLAMVWNTAEQAVQRQRAQTAADAAAHATATWMARAVNAAAAQNMAICQDGSTEVVWRAVAPTDEALRARIEKEIQDIEGTPGSPGLLSINVAAPRWLCIRPMPLEMEKPPNTACSSASKP